MASVSRVGVVRRVIHLIWGDDLDDALRPVLGVTLASSAAGSATWSFMAIWAIEELDAKAELPFALLIGAAFAATSGFLGGYLSDRIGRRRVILFGQGVMVGYPLLLLALSSSKWAGLIALSLAGMFGALGGSVGQAMVADLVAPERHQAAYASVRVAANVGVVIGPPLGGLSARARLVVGALPDRGGALGDRVAHRVPLSAAPWRIRAGGAARSAALSP